MLILFQNGIHISEKYSIIAKLMKTALGYVMENHIINRGNFLFSALYTYLNLPLIYNRNTYSNAYYTQKNGNNNSFYICVYFFRTRQNRVDI